MPKRYIPALITMIVLIASTIYAFNKESAYIDGMEVTKGVVVKLGSKSQSSASINGKTSKVNTQAIVEFELNDETFRVEGRALGYPTWEIGQHVDVYYSEENPNIARIKRWDEMYFFTLIGVIFLSCCVLFSFINFLVYKVTGKALS